jgi:NADH-quinone oxidoreductase subunit G
VWFLKTTPSVCTACGRGCNILVDVLGREIKRVRPRVNRAVNGGWICDAGRMSHRAVSSHDRIRAHRIRGVDETASAVRAAAVALERLQDAVRRLGAPAVAGVASASATNEDLYLFRLLMERCGIPIRGCITRRSGETIRFPGGFVIDAEKTSNRKGAELLLGPDTVGNGLEQLSGAVQDGTVRALAILGGDLEGGLPSRVMEMADRVEVPVLIDTRESPVASKAAVVLAGAAWAEKDGTLVNADGRVQRLSRAVDPPGDARPQRELIQEMLLFLGERKQVGSAESVFREMATAVGAWHGLTWNGIGSLGVRPGAGV